MNAPAASPAPSRPPPLALLSRWLRTNPALQDLGSLACLLFLILAVTGIYLYAVFETSVSGAYSSIHSLGPVGNFLRSLHRYSADALMLVCLAHLARELLLGRFRGFRALTWLTGLPLLIFLYLIAIGGLWLNFDRQAQYSATASAELLDALPLAGTPVMRNFLNGAAISDRLFSLLVFVHLGLPLLMVFGLWFHLQRLNRPAWWPPRRQTLGVLLTLAVLAILQPVRSLAPADLATATAELPLDWILLHLHPISEFLSMPLTWWLLALGLLALSLLPLWRSRPPIALAVVNASDCSGCRLCVDDCPYEAISLIAHPDRSPGHQLAAVDADRCAGCGICVGACPSATPFRRVAPLVSGIELAGRAVESLRQEMLGKLASLPAGEKWLLFACAEAADPGAGAGTHVAVIRLTCAGQLPMAFVDAALMQGAAGVMINACGPASCCYRHGSEFAKARLQGLRKPPLRPRARSAKVRWLDFEQGQEAGLSETIGKL